MSCNRKGIFKNSSGSEMTIYLTLEFSVTGRKKEERKQRKKLLSISTIAVYFHSSVSQASVFPRGLFLAILALISLAPQGSASTWGLQEPTSLQISRPRMFISVLISSNKMAKTLSRKPPPHAIYLFWRMMPHIFLDAPLLLAFISGGLENLVNFYLLNPLRICFFLPAATTISSIWMSWICLVNTMLSKFILPGLWRSFLSRLLLTLLPAYIFK